MSIEAAIFTALTDDDGVASLVDDRIYPDFVPGGSDYPAVTYKLVAGHDDVSTDDDVRPVDRWQITAWALTHEECLELYDALKTLWSRMAGVYAGENIVETYIIQRGDVPTLNEDDTEAERWGKFLDVMISYDD